jgi:hypothetical protein
MANTAKSSPIKSPNLWTGIATLVAGLFSYFALTPDLALADTLASEAQKAIDAISTRNYVVLITVVINVVNILYHLFKPRV